MDYPIPDHAGRRTCVRCRRRMASFCNERSSVGGAAASSLGCRFFYFKFSQRLLHVSALILPQTLDVGAHDDVLVASTKQLPRLDGAQSEPATKSDEANGCIGGAVPCGG